MATRPNIIDIEPVAGICPDPNYCTDMGGCMSGCTQGPGPEFPPELDGKSPEFAAATEVAIGTTAVAPEVLA